MFGPRWKKVLQDLMVNKTRTILTVLSIAVGVFSVGMVTYVGAICLPDMEADYESANPTSASVYTEPFDDTLLSSVRSIPGVAGVEGRSYVQGQMLLADGNKVSFTLIGIPPVSKMHINVFNSQNALPELAKREVLFDRSASSFGFQPGDQVNIMLPNGKTKTLNLKSYIHDVTTIPYMFTGEVTAYASPETIEWMGGTRKSNVLLFNVKENKKDKTHVLAVGDAISEKLKKGNINVNGVGIYAPGRHFATDIFQAIMVILNILGWLTVFLSAFLVINTINSLMAQHTRQIGIMKSIGGSTGQIVSMYLVLILSFGLISYLVSVPLASVIGYQICSYMASFVNFDLRPFRIVPEALAIQAVIAFLIPTLASLVPVLGSMRITVREAIANYGVGQLSNQMQFIDRFLEKIRFLSRPMAISLRNSIRRKGRLVLTLITLTLGGSIFIAVFNLWGAIDITMRQIEGYFLSDVNIGFSQPYRLQRIDDLVHSVPGVVSWEGWNTPDGALLTEDKKGQLNISFMAIPSDSTLIHPILTSGRWLVPGDENAIVIGNHVIKERPDLTTGKDVIIKINDKEHKFHIVGTYQMAGNLNLPIVYADRDYIAKITNTTDQVYEAHIICDQHNLESQRQAARTLQALFKSQGIPIQYVQIGVEWRQQQTSTTDVMVYFFMVMAILIALVGGLGLMGTMGMNVMERIREIGVMRAIGASNMDIQGIVIQEGILIGLISWALGVILSIPITFVLNYGVGASMFNSPLDFVFGYQGCLTWLLGVTVISTLSSILPALNASRLTIREVLAYE